MLGLSGTVFCVLSCMVNFIFAAELPFNIKPCSVKDPEEFSKCVIKHGHEAIPLLINGDKKLKIPPFDPLKIDRVDFTPSSQLSIKVRNIEVYGLKQSEIKGASIDFENDKLFFQMFGRNITIVGDYVASGQILILPLEGNGRMNMQMKNVVFNYTLVFENMSFDSNKTLKVKDTGLNFFQDEVKYNFENLFNGNKFLSDETNKVLSENWRAVHEDLSPVFGITVNKVINSIVNNILEKFYFREAFLP